VHVIENIDREEQVKLFEDTRRKNEETKKGTR
jgi:hypothetical protein